MYTPIHPLWFERLYVVREKPAKAGFSLSGRTRCIRMHDIFFTRSDDCSTTRGFRHREGSKHVVHTSVLGLKTQIGNTGTRECARRCFHVRVLLRLEMHVDVLECFDRVARRDVVLVVPDVRAVARSPHTLCARLLCPWVNDDASHFIE